MIVRERGFTLIEFMIAVTLSVLVLAALTASFVSSSRGRSEIERVNQQIENGRYAVERIADDLELAGFLSHLDVDIALTFGLPPPPNPNAKPDPCATDLATLQTVLAMHVQGYDQGATLTCLSGQNVKPNTDILVIRRVQTCIAGTANCPVLVGAPYFQASLCGAGSELGSDDAANHYRLNASTGTNFTLTRRDCSTVAERRRFVTHIYFISTRDQAGDGIPTLKRADLGTVGGSFLVTSIAQGIEDMQLEYGISYLPGGDPDGTPDVFTPNPDRFDRATADLEGFTDCNANANCVQNWRDVMSVKVHLLARNPTASPDHVDTKTYVLGLRTDGAQRTIGPLNDAFKRHAYQSMVRLMNPSGRREAG